MGKFSLFDFVSFVLPGGTLLILLYMMLASQILTGISYNIPEKEFVVIPFLVLSYLFGHITSVLGKIVEKRLSGLKHPWTIYLKSNPIDSMAINTKCIELFGYGFMDEKENVLPDKSDSLYDKMYDLIEVEEKDKKIKILLSQYAFFRNSSAVWLILFLVISLLLLMEPFNLILVESCVLILVVYATLCLLLFICSVLFLRQRLLLTMSFVYRTFIALTFNK